MEQKADSAAVFQLNHMMQRWPAWEYLILLDILKEVGLNRKYPARVRSFELIWLSVALSVHPSIS